MDLVSVSTRFALDVNRSAILSVTGESLARTEVIQVLTSF